jgi:ribonuclease HI
MFSDGASLGNPGPAGAGFLIQTPDGRPLAEGSIPLAPTTVNEAEYGGLIAGLAEARRIGIGRLHAKMDSQLVCKQLSGEYRVKAANLRPLYEKATRLIGRFDDFRCSHLPREENERADALAGAAAKRSKEQYSNDVE